MDMLLTIGELFKNRIGYIAAAMALVVTQNYKFLIGRSKLGFILCEPLDCLPKFGQIPFIRNDNELVVDW